MVGGENGQKWKVGISNQWKGREEMELKGIMDVMKPGRWKQNQMEGILWQNLL